MTRYEVVESYGYGYRSGIHIDETTAPRTLAASTVRGLVASLRQWASCPADHVSEIIGDSERLYAAHHWINGFENIRTLRIQPTEQD